MPGSDIFILLFVLCLFLTVFGTLGFMFRKARQKHPEEEGRTPLLERRVSGTIGLIRYKGPFLRFALYDGMVIIAGPPGQLLGDRDTLLKVTAERHLFVKYVKLELDDAIKGRKTISLGFGNAEDMVERIQTAVFGHAQPK